MWFPRRRGKIRAKDLYNVAIDKLGGCLCCEISIATEDWFEGCANRLHSGFTMHTVRGNLSTKFRKGFYLLKWFYYNVRRSSKSLGREDQIPIQMSVFLAVDQIFSSFPSFREVLLSSCTYTQPLVCSDSSKHSDIHSYFTIDLTCRQLVLIDCHVV